MADLYSRRLRRWRGDWRNHLASGSNAWATVCRVINLLFAQKGELCRFNHKAGHSVMGQYRVQSRKVLRVGTTLLRNNHPNKFRRKRLNGTKQLCSDTHIARIDESSGPGGMHFKL